MRYAKRIRNHGRKSRYNTNICNDAMSFQECELAILRNAVDVSDKMSKEKIVQNPEMIQMITVLEKFIIARKLMCYGGTAVNDILPKDVQFLDKDVDISDYDVYSPNAIVDVIRLADTYHEAGFLNVEAKSGLHYGTFKLYVNFIPIADITYMHPGLYAKVKKEAVVINNIWYAPPNFLRMNMYLELSRPGGDVSRWEKVFKRINLLNQHFPLTSEIPGAKKCADIEIQRRFETEELNPDTIYNIVRDIFVANECVFFGGYAGSLYARHMSNINRTFLLKVPDFDVLHESPKEVADIVADELKKVIASKLVRVIPHAAIGEIIPIHFEVIVGNETIAFVYGTIACHSYNTIHTSDGKDIKIATIDTILSFYLAFYYADKPYYYRDRILCMAQMLFDVEQKNRLSQKGILKRFTSSCYGTQTTLEDLRSERNQKFKELSERSGSEEYLMWFLKYNPSADNAKQIKAIVMKTKKEGTVKRTKVVRADEEKEKDQGIRSSQHANTRKTLKKRPLMSYIFDNIIHQ